MEQIIANGFLEKFMLACVFFITIYITTLYFIAVNHPTIKFWWFITNKIIIYRCKYGYYVRHKISIFGVRFCVFSFGCEGNNWWNADGCSKLKYIEKAIDLYISSLVFKRNIRKHISISYEGDNEAIIYVFNEKNTVQLDYEKDKFALTKEYVTKCQDEYFFKKNKDKRRVVSKININKDRINKK